ncbi:response regulator transcription factor [Flavobacterium sp.]|uniref:response regulator transcription factor n=1 Tax=Flavobacterium sp. TaxID=239 RepID=UPI00120CFDA0|nr:response regulator transcription factor [Flavobacterium sp.]RZJ70622.1 MAG: response regulator transcription factor [Flavobacterium sp.]
MKILIVEDETLLAASIAEYLQGNDFVCEWANTFASAQAKIAEYDYECIVLDIGLPDGSGLRLLQNLRESGKNDGIIIITAKDSLETKIEGFNLGADDYIVKPFALAELAVRIQALIRRKKFDGNNVIQMDGLAINVLAKTVKFEENPLDLTKMEYVLLLYLVGNSGKVLSKGAIAEHLSGDMADMLANYDFVYSHIKNLKRKLLEVGFKDKIATVYGVGYKWEND